MLAKLSGYEWAVLIFAILAVVAGAVGAYYNRAVLRWNRRSASREEFVQIRDQVIDKRLALSQKAAELYRNAVRIPGSALISTPAWLYTDPVPLSQLLVELRSTTKALAEFDGKERLVARYLPYRGIRRYSTYTDALGSIAPPRLWQNRHSYRLLSFDTVTSRMEVGTCEWFSMLDVGEVLATEFYLSLDEVPRRGSLVNPRVARRQAYRRLVGNPLILSRRPLVPSLNVLTIRRDGGDATFLLHLRDREAVAVAPGLTHVIPCGGFQPSSRARHIVDRECDLWLTLMREYAEELLGATEATSDVADSPDFVGAEPYMSLNAARLEGKLSVHVFGLGLDPLSLYAEILAAVVIDADVFDSVFASIVDRNEEGLVVKGAGMAGRAVGIPFSDEWVARALVREEWAPAGSACLSLGWRHRNVLLA